MLSLHLPNRCLYIAGKSSVLGSCPTHSSSFNDLENQSLYMLPPESPKAPHDSFTDDQTQDADGRTQRVLGGSKGTIIFVREPNSKVQGKVDVTEVIFLLEDNKAEW